MTNRIDSCNELAGAAPVAQIDKCVHTEHCCAEHGCKYGDNDCPVFLGKKPQSFLCEECREQPEPVGEEVEVVKRYAYRLSGVSQLSGFLLEVIEYSGDGLPYVLASDYDRLKAELEEAKQGQRVLAHEVEQLQAEVDRLKARIVWLECEAKCEGKVVLPEIKTTFGTSQEYINGARSYRKLVAHLNGAKP